MTKQIILMTLVTLLCGHSYSQSDWSTKRDSMLKVLSVAKDDTNKVALLLAVGMQYEGSIADSALYYYRQLGLLSDKLQYTRGRCTSLNMQAGVYCKQNNPDKAIELDKTALDIAKKSNNLKLLGRSYANMAIPYKVKGDLATAVDYYLKSSAIAEQLQDSLTIASLAINRSIIYKKLGEYQKAVETGLQGIRLARILNNPKVVNSGLVMLGSVLVEQGKYDTAIVVLNDSKKLSQQLNDQLSRCNAMVNMGVIFLQTGKYEMMKDNAEQLISLSKQINNKSGISNALQELYAYNFYKKNYAAAGDYAQQTLAFGTENNLVGLIAPAYHQLSLVEILKGNYENFKRYSDLSDSIEQGERSAEILKNTQDLDAKYSLTKKQVEIESLNREKKITTLVSRQRNLINWILSFAVLAMAVLGFLVYRNFRQKRKLLLANATLQQQRITELETAQQLLAANAVLQGQEAERSRLAQDLHDGLGGILSSTKHSFNNMKDNFIISAESLAAFDKSMAMLDTSINELRTISHNMMPEALMKFGLDTALKDYCNSINQSGAVKLSYQSFDMDEDTIASTSASVIYRIIQELLNNILKHAGADTALLQLVRKGNALSITVEDNGKGFNKQTLPVSGGIGWKNLQNRVAYLKGTVDITTAEGKGVSVNIEIPNIAA